MKPEEKSPIEKETKNIASKDVSTEIKPKQSAESKNKTGFQSALKQIGLALLFTVIGMLVILLVLYLPQSRQLKSAQTELERLTPIENQFTDLQESHEKAQAQVLVYKLMSHTSLLRIALIDNNQDAITQYLGYIEEDLGKLEIGKFPELPASLTGQFEEAQENIEKNRLDAIQDLQEFYSSLLLLADNL